MIQYESEENSFRLIVDGQSLGTVLLKSPREVILDVSRPATWSVVREKPYAEFPENIPILAYIWEPDGWNGSLRLTAKVDPLVLPLQTATSQWQQSKYVSNGSIGRSLGPSLNSSRW
jgi:hypothetical protein